MSWRLGLVPLGCVAFLLLPLQETSAAPPGVIDHNGVVRTMDDGRPQAEAVAIRNGRIVAVGDNEDVLELRNQGTRVVDLGGTVLPGFIDSHAHWIGDGSMVGYNADLAIEAALSRGWTSINEQFVNHERLDELRALDAAGRLRLRVNAYLPMNFEDEKFGHWFADSSRATPTARTFGWAVSSSSSTTTGARRSTGTKPSSTRRSIRR